CHDDLESALTKAPFKHEPAGNGDCSSCHNPHVSNEPKLLIKDRQKVCFECHEEKDLVAVKSHAGQTEKACIECHDPHLGKDKYLLKPVAQAKAK
ncbi:MAG TPA: cytochrome c3 family protein, partial [Verrucomicrobiae bacterium]|nr:cytochrome c3 family protein [Verrucomicrobiae bacterium]